MGGTMSGGSNIDHSSNASDHGNAGNLNSSSSGSSHKATVDSILSKNPAIATRFSH
jgi:hypothetical protein